MFSNDCWSAGYSVSRTVQCYFVVEVSYVVALLVLGLWQVAGSEGEWLEKQIESEKSISTLEQQIRQLKVIVLVAFIAIACFCCSSYQLSIRNTLFSMTQRNSSFCLVLSSRFSLLCIRCVT